jgi:hypothetical protein
MADAATAPHRPTGREACNCGVQFRDRVHLCLICGQAECDCADRKDWEELWVPESTPNF